MEALTPPNGSCRCTSRPTTDLHQEPSPASLIPPAIHVYPCFNLLMRADFRGDLLGVSCAVAVLICLILLLGDSLLTVAISAASSGGGERLPELNSTPKPGRFSFRFRETSISEPAGVRGVCVVRARGTTSGVGEPPASVKGGEGGGYSTCSEDGSCTSIWSRRGTTGVVKDRSPSGCEKSSAPTPSRLAVRSCPLARLVPDIVPGRSHNLTTSPPIPSGDSVSKDSISHILSPLYPCGWTCDSCEEGANSHLCWSDSDMVIRSLGFLARRRSTKCMAIISDNKTYTYLTR
jgi:hypothetical protein